MRVLVQQPNVDALLPSTMRLAKSSLAFFFIGRPPFRIYYFDHTISSRRVKELFSQNTRRYFWTLR
jgi:hypothetical protein